MATPQSNSLPSYVGWVNYFGGEVQQRFFWELPSAGSYLLESSTDLKTWTSEGQFNPKNPATISLNVEPSDTTVAYRMTKTG